MGFYSAPKAGGERAIILNDLTRDFPQGDLRVVGAEKRIGKSGNQYPCLILTDEKNQKYACSAWDRDVEACIDQWGTEVSPTDWGLVRIKKGQYSAKLVPSETPVQEVVIDAR